MQERDEPTSITEARLANIDRRITILRGTIAELELEAQRIRMGQKPHDLTPIFRPIQPCTHESPCQYCGANSPAEFAKPRRADIFWEQQVDYNQTAREQQANEQSDAKQMEGPPYKSLLQ